MEASSATSSAKGVLDAPSQNIQLHVIVLGAGIGGLTASLALRRQGHSVQVRALHVTRANIVRIHL